MKADTSAGLRDANHVVQAHLSRNNVLPPIGSEAASPRRDKRASFSLSAPPAPTQAINHDLSSTVGYRIELPSSTDSSQGRR
jgi:hypothetical protein